MSDVVGTSTLPEATNGFAVNGYDPTAIPPVPGQPPASGTFPLPWSVQPFVTPPPAFTHPPTIPYQTVQNDPWDLISFKTFGNEYFSDQLIVANPQWNQIVNFDRDIVVPVPQAVAPVLVSAVVWGSTSRLT